MTSNVKKIVFYFLALSTISIVIGFASFYLLINPAKLLPTIKEMVAQKTGYAVTTQGNIKLTLYPLLAIHLDELSLTKPTDTEPTIVLKEATLSSPWQFKNPLTAWHTHLRAKELLLRHFKANNVSADITTSDHSLLIDKFTSTCYQGHLSARAIFDRQPEQRIEWQMQLTQVALQPLINDLSNGRAKVLIDGFANINFTGNTEHLNEQPLLSAMRAALNIDMQQGDIKGIDLNYFIDKGIALLKKQKSARPLTNSTQFTRLNGLFHIAQNTVKTDNLTLFADTFKAKASGDLSLTDNALDFSLQVTPTREPRLVIPLLITGPIYKPSITLDTLLIQAVLTKEEIEQVKEKVEKELKKLPERANKLIDSLFGPDEP